MYVAHNESVRSYLASVNELKSHPAQIRNHNRPAKLRHCGARDRAVAAKLQRLQRQAQVQNNLINNNYKKINYVYFSVIQTSSAGPAVVCQWCYGQKQ
jgi:hypothetical protein